jgi:Mg2+ and Co2+ transporter CorA
VDLQTKSASAVKRVLELFPLHAMTVQEVLQPQSTDIIEVFTAHNYVFVNVLCLKLPTEDSFGDAITTAESPHGHFFRGPASLAPLRSEFHDEQAFAHRGGCAADAFSPDDDTFGNTAVYDEAKHTVMSAIIFEDWVLTIHQEPFQGLSEVFLRLKMHFGLGRSQKAVPRGIGGGDPGDLAAWHRGPTSHLMTSAWVLATCLEFVTESFLPDPTVALAEVDSVDEMVLLVGSEQYKKDQADLLLRIAILRRKISSQRASLFHKEQFVQQLLMPAIRTTFVSKHSSIHEHYKHTLSQLAHVAQRLDAARDILNQANSNFISNITMNMSHSSSRMNLKMELLTQVATLCLPLNLVAGIFGMNVEVPFQTDTHTSLTAFYVIIGCMAGWFLLMSPQLISTFRQMRQQEKEDAPLHRGEDASEFN